MPVGKVRQYPYFVRLFHTSTPLRSVELRMKKESRDLVASTGHLWDQELLYNPPCPVPWALPKTRNRLRKVHGECRMIRRMVLCKPGNSSTNKSPKKRETPIRLQWSLMTLNKYIKEAFVLCQIKQNSHVNSAVVYYCSNHNGKLKPKIS